MELLKQLLKKTQKELLQYLSEELPKYYNYNNITATHEYIAARGTIPIVLVAHLDTVFMDEHRKDILIVHDKEQQILWSPQGLGTDDRAGVFMILTLLNETKLRPHILFTTNEETEATGAFAVADKSTMKRLFGKVSYVIELDRQGYLEAVYYDCNNPDFEDYITSFGFETRAGTFSDISIICPEWEVAGVNLSVGYYFEHSFAEHFYLGAWYNTYKRLIEMLKVETGKKWEYIPSEISKEEIKKMLGVLKNGSR